jgi:DHA3 family multidrug efflux protein-like MFS transporter
LLGEGESRGIALIFVGAALVTVILALLALLTPTYRTLVRSFNEALPNGTDQDDTDGVRAEAAS